MRNILLLRDYRDQFYFSTKKRGASLDMEKLKHFFQERDFDLKVENFIDVDFRNRNYNNCLVLYQSSEDPSLYYKDYIEDILLGLQMSGAILVPEFKFFRAHHNKVFMEILRDLSVLSSIKNIKSNNFGTYEEYLKNETFFDNRTYVFKVGAGSRSKGVKLLEPGKVKNKIVYRFSKSATLHNLRWKISKILFNKEYVPQSNNRRKFIVQTFITELKGDYRILVYDKKYYVLHRDVRDNNFTASGSGRITFNIKLPDGLLDFAKSVYEAFNVPFISLDIGYKDNTFFLFEFQFVCLGQYAIEKSTFFYSIKDSSWVITKEIPCVELEFVSSTVSFIKRNNL